MAPPNDPVTLLQQDVRDLWSHMEVHRKALAEIGTTLSRIETLLSERCANRGAVMAAVEKELGEVKKVQEGRQCGRHDERLKRLEAVVKWAAVVLSGLAVKAAWEVWVFYHSGGVNAELKALVEAAVKAGLQQAGH